MNEHYNSERTNTIVGENKRKTAYQRIKADLRNYAMSYQILLSERNSSYGDILWFNNEIEPKAKRYGLIKEFRENGII